MATNNYVSVLRSNGSEESMQITRLPFYNLYGEPILKIQELPTLSFQVGRLINSAFSFTFQPKFFKLICNHGSRFELQLRMFLLDPDKALLVDDFPPNCIIKLNGNSVVLPESASTDLFNSAQKRYSRPVNITPFFRSINLEQKHKLKIQWLNDFRKWAVGIWVVLPVDAWKLVNRLVHDGPLQAANETKKKIIQMLNCDENGIKMDQLKISLKCPITKTRMKIPARSKTCSHLQCFDLSNFLQLNEKTPTWKCPICNGDAHYDNLIIDLYFMDLLESVKSKNVEEVELLQNGKWKNLDTSESKPTTSVKFNNVEVINLEENIIDLDDSDDDYSGYRIRPIQVSTRRRTNNVPSFSFPVVKNSEIITLDSSDANRDKNTSPAISEQVKFDAARISNHAMSLAVTDVFLQMFPESNY